MSDGVETGKRDRASLQSFPHHVETLEVHVENNSFSSSSSSSRDRFACRNMERSFQCIKSSGAKGTGSGVASVAGFIGSSFVGGLRDDEASDYLAADLPDGARYRRGARYSRLSFSFIEGVVMKIKGIARNRIKLIDKIFAGATLCRSYRLDRDFHPIIVSADVVRKTLFDFPHADLTADLDEPGSYTVHVHSNYWLRITSKFHWDGGRVK